MLVRKRPLLLSISSFDPFLCIDLILIVFHWLGICCVTGISLNILYVMLLTITPPSNIISFFHLSSSASFFLFNFLIVISTRSFVISNVISNFLLLSLLI